MSNRRGVLSDWQDIDQTKCMLKNSEANS